MLKPLTDVKFYKKYESKCNFYHLRFVKLLTMQSVNFFSLYAPAHILANSWSVATNLSTVKCCTSVTDYIFTLRLKLSVRMLANMFYKRRKVLYVLTCMCACTGIHMYTSHQSYTWQFVSLLTGSRQPVHPWLQGTCEFCQCISLPDAW
jgi:hypothetical protein